MNLFLMPMNPRRGLIYALLALAEAGWLAPALLNRAGEGVADRSGWFLLLLSLIGAAMLLGWVADTYRLPFEVSRSVGLGLVALGWLALLHATLYPESAFWQLGWLAAFVRALFTPSPQRVAAGWVTAAVAYLWWRCLTVGYHPPAPNVPAFTLRIGAAAFALLLALGKFQPEGAPSLAFLLLFVCGGLLAAVLSHTQPVAERHGEGAVGSMGTRLLTGGVVVLAILFGAMALASLLSMPVLERVFGGLGAALGLLLKPLAAILIRLLIWLNPLLEGIVNYFRSIAVDSGAFAPTPQPTAAPAPVEPPPASAAPVWWAAYTVWLWRGLAALAVVWIFYRLSSRLRGRYREAAPPPLDTTEEAIAAEGPGLGGLASRGLQRLADLLNLGGRFGRAEQLRAAATIRRIYAALTALAAQKGVARPPHQTPLEFLAPLSAAWPDLSVEFQTITRAYVRVHYGQLPEDRASLEAVRQAWRTVYSRLTRGDSQDG